MNLSIGYLIPEFPGVTHIIFWREIRRLRESGAAVRILSSRRPEQLPPHAFASEPCTYLWPVSTAALRGLPSPARLWRQLRFVLGLKEGGWRERLKVLAMLPSSWMLVAACARAGIRHVHVHSFANTAYVAALAHLAADLPYSLVLHGSIRVYGANHDAKLRHAAFACAISDETRADIEAVQPGVCLADDIACGVDLDVFSFRERRPGERLRLISVGRLNHCKGLHFAFEAIARLKEHLDLSYTLVGSGPHEDELRARVRELGLDNIVHFAGPKDQEEVAALLHEHDVAVLTSYGLGEATATAIREAMATGMPVIMSRIGAAERMIEHGEDGLLVPQADVAAIADAIAWYAQHKDRIPAMGHAARRRAEREFSDATGPRLLARAISERLEAATTPVAAEPAHRTPGPVRQLAAAVATLLRSQGKTRPLHTPSLRP